MGVCFQLHMHMFTNVHRDSDVGVFGTSGVGAHVLSHVEEYRRNPSTSDQTVTQIRKALASSFDPECFRIIEKPMLTPGQCAVLRTYMDNHVKQEYNGHAPGDLTLRLRLGDVCKLLGKATVDRLRCQMRHPLYLHRIVLRRWAEHGKFIEFRLNPNNVLETLEVCVVS